MYFEACLKQIRYLGLNDDIKQNFHFNLHQDQFSTNLREVSARLDVIFVSRFEMFFQHFIQYM